MYISISISFLNFSCGSNKKEVGRFCSLNADKPFPIFTPDGCIDIIYRLSKQNPDHDSNGGFKASYNYGSYQVNRGSINWCVNPDLILWENGKAKNFFGNN